MVIYPPLFQLPGISNVVGLWPAVWAMGNLGRAGYGADTRRDGTSNIILIVCAWVTFTFSGLTRTMLVTSGRRLTKPSTMNPRFALTSGYSSSNYELSYLPGQRLSRCTCDGESHPGPKHSDGTYVGRSAPEMDVFEAQISDGIGQVSQSGQWAVRLLLPALR